MLLGLQLWLRPIDGFPAVAAVTRPTTAIPVVAVNGTIFARVNVVLPDGYTGVRVGVINEPTAPGRALAGVNVAQKSCFASGNDASVRVVRGDAAIPVSGPV